MRRCYNRESQSGKSCFHLASSLLTCFRVSYPGYIGSVQLEQKVVEVEHFYSTKDGAGQTNTSKSNSGGKKVAISQPSKCSSAGKERTRGKHVSSPELMRQFATIIRQVSMEKRVRSLDDLGFLCLVTFPSLIHFEPFVFLCTPLRLLNKNGRGHFWNLLMLKGLDSMIITRFKIQTLLFALWSVQVGVMVK